jgi:hypothetical protein
MVPDLGDMIAAVVPEAAGWDFDLKMRDVDRDLGCVWV